mmetsp:Transcript_98818/g.258138  ORF Transcript_98818/g.258138 Transcript_98818/m.258138 type:complete len:600 (+) Transcript_98818:67-1866(+)
MPQVQAYVYDITGGMAKMISMSLVGKQIDVVPHTGIVVFGKEYFFGSGPCIGVPGQSVPAQVAQVLDLGETSKTPDELEAYINSVLALEHTSENYSLMTHNCNHYAMDVAKFLLNGKGIPEWIVNIAQDALSTPQGAGLRTMIEQADTMMRSQSGGAPGGMNPYGNVGTGAGAGLNPFGHVGSAAPAAAPALAPVAKPAGVADTFSEGLEDAFDEMKSASVEEKRACLSTLLKVTQNLEKNPDDPKFRRIKADNPAFSKKVIDCAGGTEALLAAGWAPDTHEGEDVWAMCEANADQQKFFRENFERELAKLPPPPAPTPAPAPFAAPAPAPDFGGMGGMGGMGGRQRQQQQQRGPAKGSDLQCDVEFPFATACFGGEVPVSIRREEPCSTCDGKGIKKDATSSSCRQCGGQGVVLQVMQTPLGVMQTQQVCPACQGSAIDPSCLCGSCRGKGTKTEGKEVSVKVPPGCDNGNQLRVRGEGDRGTRGGPAGDLYIAVKVAGSSEFQREGFDIYTESSVSAWDAMLGTQVVVKTIDGNAEIKIPGGTQPETRMRIRGRGVPKLGKPGERGDHYVTMKVDIPKSLSSEQAEKVKLLQAEMKK